MAVILWGKNVELSTGRNVLRISTSERDNRLHEWYERIMYQMTHVTAKSIGAAFHRVVVTAETFSLALFVRLGKRFSKIGDIVRGKDLPKNRGSISVSFFLKNIEEGRKNM